MQKFDSFQEMAEAQRSPVLGDVKTLNVSVTKSVKALPEGIYKFDIIPDKDTKGASNVYGIEVNAPPERKDSTFSSLRNLRLKGI